VDVRRWQEVQLRYENSYCFASSIFTKYFMFTLLSFKIFTKNNVHSLLSDGINCRLVVGYQRLRYLSCGQLSASLDRGYRTHNTSVNDSEILHTIYV
jgi:hypothetical protein